MDMLTPTNNQCDTTTGFVAADDIRRHRKPDDTSYDPHNQKFSPSQPEAEFFTIGDPECCQPPPLHLQSPQDSLVRALQETCQPRGV